VLELIKERLDVMIVIGGYNSANTIRWRGCARISAHVPHRERAGHPARTRAAFATSRWAQDLRPRLMAG